VWHILKLAHQGAAPGRGESDVYDCFVCCDVLAERAKGRRSDCETDGWFDIKLLFCCRSASASNVRKTN